MSNLTEEFSRYLLKKSEAIGEETTKKAASCVADYTAVAQAGARKNLARWNELVDLLPAGKARLFGFEKRVSGKDAALINGFNAHALELDDGQRFAMIHLGASVISALSAARDETGFSDEAMLRGVIMGYEAACRAAICMQPSHKNRGYHAAGTCGTIGCAAAVAFALGFDESKLKRALTLAAAGAQGLLEIQEQGSELKPYNVGRAAMDGLAAAYTALADFETPDDMLGGERGFFRSVSDEYDETKLTQETDYFEIGRIYVKPYASCRHSHSAVEAAIRLHGKFDPADVLSADVRTYKLGVKGHDHTDIRGVASAKLSTPYAVAAALLYGRADLSVFEPLDEKIVALAQKIGVREDAQLTKESPQKRVAVVSVTLKDGTVLSERVDYAKGDPENPMSEEELKQKIIQLSKYENRQERKTL